MKLSSLFCLVLLLAGCVVQPNYSLPSKARFFIEDAEKSDATFTLPTSKTKIPVRIQPILMEFDVASVTVTKEGDDPALAFQLAPGSTRDYARLTNEYIGHRIVLGVDGIPVAARLISTQVTDGKITMVPELPAAALTEIAERINKAASMYQKKS